jgi:hypothetical protein
MKKQGLTGLIRWLVIALISFLIILFLIFTLGWKQQTKAQICHESVVIRASTVVDETHTVDTPLKCETEKICITSGGRQNCDQDFLGEEYDTMKISGKNKEEKQYATNKIIAEKLEECWWMMGGSQKLKVYGREAYTKQHCNICSRIAFSQELQTEFNNKLEGTNKKFLNQDSKYIQGKVWEFVTNNPANYMEGYSEETDYKDMSQKAIVFAEYDMAKIYEWATKAGVVLVASFTPIVGPVTGAGIGGVIAGSQEVDKIGNYLTDLLNPKEENIAASVLFVEYDTQALRDMKCTSFEGKL